MVYYGNSFLKTSCSFPLCLAALHEDGGTNGCQDGNDDLYQLIQCFFLHNLLHLTSSFFHHTLVLVISVPARFVTTVSSGVSTIVTIRWIRGICVRTAVICRCIRGAGGRGDAVGFFEGDVLQQRFGIDVLLDDLTVLLAGAYHDALGLRLEQDAARGDGRCRTVVGLGDTDAGEAYLEDADAYQTNLLTHLQEVLHGGTQFVEGGLDVTALQRGLCLDEVGNLVGLDELLVIDGLGVILVVSLRIVRIVVL